MIQLVNVGPISVPSGNSKSSSGCATFAVVVKVSTIPASDVSGIGKSISSAVRRAYCVHSSVFIVFFSFRFLQERNMRGYNLPSELWKSFPNLRLTPITGNSFKLTYKTHINHCVVCI